MSWGVDLWDHYDQVCSHTDHGVEFVKRVSVFIEKRIVAEQNYAKELRRLVRGFRKKDEDGSKYTEVQAFSKMIHETNDLAGQRELIAEYLQADVLEPLKVVAREITAERRKHMASGTECLRQLKASMDALERSKRTYERASEEAESALHSLEKADNDPNSTKAKIDKLTTTLRSKENTAEECRNNYILQLEETNAKRNLHYTSEMPEVFKSFQDMNVKRLERYKELLAAYSECHRRVSPVVNTCLDNITAASAAVDPAKDNQQLIEDSKTGFPIPGDVQFEEYQGKSSAKKGGVKGKKKVEPREDFSHLPPERRRKKLQGKVSDLEAASTKAQSDKTAMEKMQSIYSQNPSLGDASAVAQSLEQTNGKIVQLSQELEKYRAWLADAEAQIASAKSPRTSRTKLAPPNPTASSVSKFSPTFGRKKSEQLPSKSTPDPQGKEYESFSDEDDDPEDSKPIRTGMMLYDFDGQNEDEVTAPANAKVMILEDLGDGWLRVRHGTDEGYVPQSYVQ